MAVNLSKSKLKKTLKAKRCKICEIVRRWKSMNNILSSIEQVKKKEYTKTFIFIKYKSLLHTQFILIFDETFCSFFVFLHSKCFVLGSQKLSGGKLKSINFTFWPQMVKMSLFYSFRIGYVGKILKYIFFLGWWFFFFKFFLELLSVEFYLLLLKIFFFKTMFLS